MKTTYRTEKVNAAADLVVSFDVSKEFLDMRLELPEPPTSQGMPVTRVAEDHFRNRNATIQSRLLGVQQIARERGYQNVQVICEATGGFEHTLLRSARRLGCKTAYVSGEAVSKAKVIDHNDTGKSDQQDPAVMLTLSRMGKVLTHRVLPPEYRRLRLLGRMYEDVDGQYRALRCRVHAALRELFADYSKPKDFIFSAGGQSLVETFGGNPYRIVQTGFKRFCTAMKRKHPRIKSQTLNVLWNDAASSALHQMPAEEIVLLQDQLLHTWKSFQGALQRRQELRAQMEEQYLRIVSAGEPVPRPDPSFVSNFNLARIVSETGPLSDFPTARAILKYAGLNLCRRQSGRHEGRIKTSHRGSAHLRHALGVTALDVVRAYRCFGPYFHKRKNKDRPGGIVMTAVMRKLLVAIWVLGTKKIAFDKNRLYACEAQYKAAA